MTLTFQRFDAVKVSDLFQIAANAQTEGDDPVGRTLRILNDALLDSEWSHGDTVATLVPVVEFIEFVDYTCGREYAAPMVDAVLTQFRMEWITLHVNLEA